MAGVLKKQDKGGLLRKHNIIEYILNSDLDGVKNAIEEDMYCVNSIHEPSGMNAAMLAATGRLPVHLDEILEVGTALDFAHRDRHGRDLLDAAMTAADQEIVQKVHAAFHQFAPHIINNWPEP